MRLALVPWIVVAVVHLVSKALRDAVPIAAIVDDATRPLLMLTLLAGVATMPRPWSSTTCWLLAALCCSWIGDVTLRWFLVGLGSFLCAHVCFVVAMTKAWPSSRASRVVIAAAVLWWCALLTTLHTSLGPLLVPVAIYGAVLAAMAIVASRGGALAVVGAGCFVVSDSLLALRLFGGGLDGRVADVVTMALYVVAQGLLAHALSSTSSTSSTPAGGSAGKLA